MVSKMSGTPRVIIDSMLITFATKNSCNVVKVKQALSCYKLGWSCGHIKTKPTKVLKMLISSAKFCCLDVL